MSRCLFFFVFGIGKCLQNSLTLKKGAGGKNRSLFLRSGVIKLLGRAGPVASGLNLTAVLERKIAEYKRS